MMIRQLTGYDGPRTPRPDEWDAALDMSRSVFFKDSATYSAAAKRWPMALRDGFRENCFATFHQGKPAGMIARLERDFVSQGCLLRMGFIGGVCTHPDHRNKGLAGATLAASMDVFHKHEVDFVCISGARRLYFDAGANYAGGSMQFTLTREALSQFEDAGVQVRQATVQDAALLAKLNQREGLRFVRPLEDYVLTLKYGHCSGRACGVHVIARSGIPMGYVIATKPEHKDGVTSARVLECAGDHGSILAGLARLVEQTGGGAKLVADLASGSGLADLLSACGVPGQPLQTPCTIKAVDFARTMSKLRPYLAERLPKDLVDSLGWAQGGDRYVGWSARDTLVIDRELNMLWTLLGAPPDKELAGVQASGAMQTLIEECLPIPLPSVAMNKI